MLPEGVPNGQLSSRSLGLLSLATMPVPRDANSSGYLPTEGSRITGFAMKDLKTEKRLDTHREPEVTEGTKSHNVVAQSEQLVPQLHDDAKDAMYVHNMRGCYLSVNRAAEILSGYPRDEIIGRPFWNFLAPEYVKQARKYLCQKLEEVGETTYEVEIVTKSGRRVPVEVNSRLIYKDNVPIAVQGIVRDITKRKRVLRALEKYSQQFRKAQKAEQQKIALQTNDEIIIIPTGRKAR